MPVRNPFTVAKLKTIKAQIYAKALKVILKEKLKDGETVPFSLLLNHVYAGLDEKKSAKLPFLLLGEPKDGEATWKKFRDSEVSPGKKQKDFMVVGTCTRQGDHLMLSINRSKGLSKIPPKAKAYLDNAIKNANPKITISTKDGGEDKTVVGAVGVSDGKQPEQETKTKDTGSSTQPETGTTPKVTEEKKKKVVEKYKKEKQDEAKELGQKFKDLKALSSSDSVKKVAKNIKKGRTTKKDLERVKELNQVFSSTEKLYKKTAKQIQKKFNKSYKELVKNKKKFYQLSLATKQSKKSLAETLANSYYEKKLKRVATSDEVNDIQKIIKDVILMNKKRRKKAKQALLFKATSYVLKKTGPKKFKAKYVNQILQKKVA
ncbi:MULTISPECIES: hypothetical protein [unclassified Aureispira]|uniref:hypothetical protein n=1 Tax=unclassified Aureispira TaxID=2649989 RepID=UPI000696B1B5|nr:MULTISPECIES: hypothetical protein [unclassified Aureispira]WMX15692.1 hypothetical protein QP953_04765 [Aureispira sp. CCB-E]